MEVISCDLMEEEAETPTTGATTEEAAKIEAILATDYGIVKSGGREFEPLSHQVFLPLSFYFSPKTGAAAAVCGDANSRGLRSWVLV
ncbi:hypothetical protein R1flu_025851 [Riccia fluitans]|uniref:Uncharacterized protein n=1 Tax=Riccia fluitans TaxID=41844 RepID=A0ABD1XZC6_9MARC